MATTTKGTVSSNFPDTLPSFTAQSEAKDPASEDPTLAEGRDANSWSAEVEAIAAAMGTGGRGEVTVSGSTATVESLKYVYTGTQKSYAGTVSLSLFSTLTNYVYIDVRDNLAKVATSGWPSTVHIRLAVWDDSGSVATLTDSRAHDLGTVGESFLLSTTPSWKLDGGEGTIPQGDTSVDIAFNITFTANPLVLITPNTNPSTTPAVTARTTTGATVALLVAEPVDDIDFTWIAIGVEASGGSGSP